MKKLLIIVLIITILNTLAALVNLIGDIKRLKYKRLHRNRINHRFVLVQR